MMRKEADSIRLFFVPSARLSLAQLRALPTVPIEIDIHCVMGWSKPDTYWQGVQFKSSSNTSRL